MVFSGFEFSNPWGHAVGDNSNYPLGYFKDHNKILGKNGPGVYIFRQCKLVDKEEIPRYWLYKTNDTCTYSEEYLKKAGYTPLWNKEDFGLVSDLNELGILL